MDGGPAVSTTPETGSRIRWEPTEYGFIGNVGTEELTVFRLWQQPPGKWNLAADLPGDDLNGPDPDKLKDDAEKWLEEVVLLFGASFEPGARWSALGDWLYAQVQDANMAERAAFADGLTDAEVRHSTRGAVWRAALEKMHELESGERTGDGEPR
jgi:hypothetical protein